MPEPLLALQRAPRLLVPVLSLTDRLRTRSRLLVLVALLLVPSLLAAGSFAMVIGGQVQFAEYERAGVHVVRPALQAMTTSAAGLEPDLTALAAAVAAHPELGAEPALDAVVEAADGPARVSALAALVATVGDSSKLILDPDLDSFYVMDALVVQLPRALTSLGTPPAPGQDATAMTDRALQAGLFTVAAEALRSDVGTAVRQTSRVSLDDELEPVLEASNRLSALAQLTAATWSRRRPATLPHGLRRCEPRARRARRSPPSSTSCSSGARTGWPFAATSRSRSRCWAARRRVDRGGRHLAHSPGRQPHPHGRGGHQRRRPAGARPAGRPGRVRRHRPGRARRPAAARTAAVPRPAHRSAEPADVPRPAGGGAERPGRVRGHRPVPGPRPLQVRQRPARARGGRRAAQCGRRPHPALHAGGGHRGALRRGRVRRRADRPGRDAGAGRGGTHHRRPARAVHHLGGPVHIGVTIGIAQAHDGVGADELLAEADVALYGAKRDGGGRARVYDPALRAEQVHRLQLEADLQSALPDGQLDVVYQPIVHLGRE
jgi:hypothetical protein